MKLLVIVLLSAIGLVSCATMSGGDFHDDGRASWYGGIFHGRKTANGERFDKNELTAAHRTLPFGTMVCVKSKATRREVTVRINDRGPFAKGRIIDLSQAAASKLGMIAEGETEVDIYSARCP